MKPKPKPARKLTAAQMRVAIAKDVLGQIKLGRICIRSGAFVRSHLDHPDGRSYNQATVLKLKTCTACAVGAAILCAMRLFNKLDLHTIESPLPLEGFFSRKQVRLIEMAFEMGRGYYCLGFNIKDGQVQTVAFGEKHGDATARAQAIFRNIITNKGTFIP